MTPSSGGIIREIGWKCKAVGQGDHGVVSVCPHVWLNFSCKSVLGTCLSASPGWELCSGAVDRLGTTRGGQWTLPQGAGERRWPGVAGAWMR